MLTNTYAHTCSNTFTHAHTNSHIHTHAHTHTHVLPHTFTQTHTCLHTLTQTRTCSYMLTLMFTHKLKLTLIHSLIPTHTLIHTLTPTLAHALTLTCTHTCTRTHICTLNSHTVSHDRSWPTSAPTANETEQLPGGTHSSHSPTALLLWGRPPLHSKVSGSPEGQTPAAGTPASSLLAVVFQGRTVCSRSILEGGQSPPRQQSTERHSHHLPVRAGPSQHMAVSWLRAGVAGAHGGGQAMRTALGAADMPHRHAVAEYQAGRLPCANFTEVCPDPTVTSHLGQGCRVSSEVTTGPRLTQMGPMPVPCSVQGTPGSKLATELLGINPNKVVLTRREILQHDQEHANSPSRPASALLTSSSSSPAHTAGRTISLWAWW